jgi:hypothetical protein
VWYIGTAIRPPFVHITQSTRMGDGSPNKGISIPAVRRPEPGPISQPFDLGKYPDGALRPVSRLPARISSDSRRLMVIIGTSPLSSSCIETGVGNEAFDTHYDW